MKCDVIIVISCILVMLSAMTPAHSYYVNDEVQKPKSELEECSPWSPCLWAICKWHIKPYIDRSCQLVTPNCECPEDLPCTKTKSLSLVAPDHIIHNFRCQPRHHHQESDSGLRKK